MLLIVALSQPQIISPQGSPPSSKVILASYKTPNSNKILRGNYPFALSTQHGAQDPPIKAPGPTIPCLSRLHGQLPRLPIGPRHVTTPICRPFLLEKSQPLIFLFLCWGWLPSTLVRRIQAAGLPKNTDLVSLENGATGDRRWEWGGGNGAAAAGPRRRRRRRRRRWRGPGERALVVAVELRRAPPFRGTQGEATTWASRLPRRARYCDLFYFYLVFW